tara:strand:- start:2157 stop:2336 length:180 start_codon:yes stop_codon:yes gene_type:complete
MNSKSMEDDETLEFMGGTWKQNGMTNEEVSKEFPNGVGGVDKISDGNGKEWVRVKDGTL